MQVQQGDRDSNYTKPTQSYKLLLQMTGMNRYFQKFEYSTSNPPSTQKKEGNENNDEATTSDERGTTT